MADKVTLDIKGQEDLQKQFSEIIKGFDPDKVEPILFDGATTIRDAARGNIHSVTGNLYKGTIVKQLNKIGSNPRSALAGINYRRAPHASLLEWGTSKMRPHPFFRPAVDANWNKVINDITNKLRSLVDGAL